LAEDSKDRSDDEMYEEYSAILNALSHPDALKIFNEIKKGVTSSTKTIKKLGLTQKRYYTRLKELISLGLVKKRKGAYRLTVLGEAIHKLGSYALDVLDNRDKLVVLSKLMDSEKLSDVEKKNIIKSLEVKKGQSLLEDMYGIKKVLKVVDTYEELVKTVAYCFDRAQKEVRIASRYTPMEVAEKVHDNMVRNVKMDWIDGDKSNISSKLQIMKFVFMNPRAVINFYEAMNNPNNSAKYYPELPYSFMVVDGDFGAFEITDPINNEFVFAIFFEDRDLCERLNQVFDDLKEKAKEHPYNELAKKISKIRR
jgi:DNA-binding HxlR family transcriptional regulator